MASITYEELQSHIESLQATDRDRPPGFYTYEDMAFALVDSGRAVNYNTALSRIKMFVKELHRAGRLEVVDAKTVGPSGRIGHAKAYKILPAPKQPTTAKKKR